MAKIGPRISARCGKRRASPTAGIAGWFRPVDANLVVLRESGDDLRAMQVPDKSEKTARWVAGGKIAIGCVTFIDTPFICGAAGYPYMKHTYLVLLCVEAAERRW